MKKNRKNEKTQRGFRIEKVIKKKKGTSYM